MTAYNRRRTMNTATVGPSTADPRLARLWRVIESPGFRYSTGRHGLYMEVHAPPEDLDAIEFDKIYTKLRNIEKESGRTLDWSKVKKVLAEARGIPVPIFEIRQGSEKGTTKTIEVKHPEKLYGRPEIPELQKEAWYILAADERDEIDALRLAAIINHQGPQIPARVLSKSDNGYRVIAGPFNDLSGAKDAIKRLKIDLEIDGTLIEPVRTDSRSRPEATLH